MAITSKQLRSAQHIPSRRISLLQRFHILTYAVGLLLAALAVYAIVGLALGKVHVMIDDIRYGRPRTMHIESFVGHDEGAGQPTHLMAMNLNRQVMIIEFPG